MVGARLNPEDVFCGWGEGPDVGVNLALPDGTLVALDFTASEAHAIGKRFHDAALKAEELELQLRAYEDAP